MKAPGQVVKPGVEGLRPTLRSMGIGHSFQMGKLWLIPVNGSEGDGYVAKVHPLLQGPKRDVTTEKVDPAETLVWNGVVKRVVRDAVCHALDVKAKAFPRLVARGSVILDFSERQPGARSGAFVVPGLDFHRIHRATENRVLVAISFVYQVFDAQNDRIKDKAITTPCCTRAYWHNADNRWGKVARLSEKVLPLSVAVADRRLEFPSLGLALPADQGARPW